jgi:hypothetical protein
MYFNFTQTPIFYIEKQILRLSAFRMFSLYCRFISLVSIQ